MIYSAITGVSGYLPERVIDNHELARSIDTSDEWISTRTGIKQRHVVAEDQNTEHLACEAALGALRVAATDSNDIDMVVVATSTPATIFPSVACAVQKKLGLGEIAAFDIQAACSGFVYALDIADSYIRSGSCKHVLVIGSDCMSRVVDWQDRNTCILFGDGAGAAVVSRSDVPGIIYSRMRANGDYGELLSIPGVAGAAAEQAFLQMDGHQVFRLAVNLVAEDLVAAMQEAKLSCDDIDWLIPHQANRRIMQQLAKKTGIAENKIIDSIALHGNTSAASIPLAMQHGLTTGLIKPGHRLMLTGFGGGFTWGTVILHYHGAGR